MSRTSGSHKQQSIIDGIARETSTSTDVVSALYEEEMIALLAQARIKQFVGVIATRRVKQQLRALAHADH